ncbi:MAG: Ig-like domain-containing protein, partial [Desulfuromonadales bacterium]|nr:Ig-like domain-containing protein [Desulfuromonadales bacterium]
MANQTGSENVKSWIRVDGQEHQVERVHINGDGTVRIPHSETELLSVEIADVDLLLSFADGTFVIIPNGAIEAIGSSPPLVVFNDSSGTDPAISSSPGFSQVSLDDLFKMAGIVNIAKGGSLRVVTDRVDGAEAAEIPDAGDQDTETDRPVSSNTPTQRTTSNSPMVEIGFDGTGLDDNPGAGGNMPSVQSVDPEQQDPVTPQTTPRPTVYEDALEIETVSDAILVIDRNITADDIINMAEAGSVVPVTGQVYGDANSGDLVTLTVNETDFSAPISPVDYIDPETGLAQTILTFSIDVPGQALVADSDSRIDGSLTTVRETVLDQEDYRVDITPPKPTIDLDQITEDNRINLFESGEQVSITGRVGGDAVEGDTVTLTLDGAEYTGLVDAELRFSIGVSGSALVADEDLTVEASIVTAADVAGNPSEVDTDTKTYLVDVEAPVVASEQVLSYEENRGPGAVIAAVAATDNTGIAGYRFSDTGTSESVDGYFRVTENGQIVLTEAGASAGAHNDFETEPNSFGYSIEVVDAAGNWSAPETVILRVVNLDEESPVVTPGQKYFYAENQVLGTVVGTVAASDDIGVTGFEIVGGSGASYFAIDNSGQVTLVDNAANDFELGSSFSLEIAARDAVGNVSTQTVILIVNNVNEAPTGLTLDNSSVDENLAGTVVGGVNVSDPDFGDKHTYSINDSRFEVEAGQLRLKEGVSLDYEIEPSVNISITAKDNGNLIYTELFDISVKDTNDAPMITVGGTDSASKGLTESDAALSVSGTLSVEDQDVSDTVSTSVTAVTVTGDDNGIANADLLAMLTVDSGNVIDNLSTTGTINWLFNSKPEAFNHLADGETLQLEYSVIATDSQGSDSAAQVVTITITGTNDVPVAVNDTYIIFEDTQLIGDLGTNDILSGDGVNTFTKIDGPLNGTLVLNAGGTFTYTPNSDWYGTDVFTYEVSDIDGSTSVASGNITVIPVDDTNPEIPAGQVISYAENQVLGTVVGSVAASDDIGVTGFEIVGGSGASYFAIDNNGQVTLVDNAANDYESTSSFSLEIAARDAAGNVTTETVEVEVADVDEIAPSVTANQSFIYAEKQSAGYVVGTVAANDAGGVTGFKIASGNSGNYFSIDSSGQIMLTQAGATAFAASNDYETLANSFTLGVQAQDAAGNWSPVTNVTLQVIDVDEIAPEVTLGQAFTYEEDQLADTVIGTVAAADNVGVIGYRFGGADADAIDSMLSYDGYYRISPNGQVAITASGVAAGVAQNDFGIAPNTFDYAIEAGDAAGNWSDAVDITFNVVLVTDGQDRDVPVVTPGQAFDYSENQGEGALVATVAASDNWGVHDFKIVSVNGVPYANDPAIDYFTISNNGQVRLTATGVAAGIESNDFEIPDNLFSLGIQASDIAGNVSAVEYVTLNLLDVNEAPTDLDLLNNTVDENSPGAIIGPLTVTDQDLVENHLFASDDIRFEVVGGELKVVDGVSLDFETEPNIDINITVTDKGGLTYSELFTISVNDINDAPVALDVPSSVNEDGPGITVTADFSDDDAADTHTFSVDTTGTLGSVIDNGDGTFFYDPNGQFEQLADGATASDTFTYTVNDGNGGVSTANVNITITGQNDAPVALDVNQTVNEDGPGITISAEFSDDVGDTHTFDIDTSGTIGTVTNNADGTFTYVSNGQFEYLSSGETTTDTFTYTVTDNHLVSSGTQTVTVTITGDTEDPVVEVADLLGEVTEMVTPIGNLTDTGTINFSDADLGDVHSVTEVVSSVGALGTLTASVTTGTDNTNGAGGVVTWNYAVDASAVEYLGEYETKVETFTFSIIDGHGGSVEQTVEMTIRGANDAPVLTVTPASTDYV